jgi:cytochrome c oxidase subunit 3
MSASHSAQGTAAPYYYVPAHSSHPVQASVSMLMVLIGAALWINSFEPGPWLFLIGVLCMLTTLFFWFKDAIGESEGGLNSQRVDHSYRWSMSWFIFSEVMFFGAFFGSLWYTREVSLPWLTNIDHQTLLWPHFTDTWPNFGPAGTIAPFKSVGPFWLPTINTALLLTSGLTLTIAHHALRANHRSKTIFWMVITVLLGFAFVACQAHEYYESYTELNLRFDSGAFGSLFYMLTGFHGFHVILGATMLTIITLRLIRGHFTPSHHFGFEGAAWYWHFVDVVWLGLYLFVYWL